ncbi:MAG: transketolase C-terminal domain-containing protein [Candidatus Staskawiczbacteria bacterium]|nr:transketolase C-terminal domain-containing protein [Candidatus Staskawiczbacteria bacterium]
MHKVKNKKRLISYMDAISEALGQEMERDSNVFVYGLDVTDHKRIFGSTKGLEKFGEKRFFGTPLSEEAMTGVGLGAAINGLRPVHNHIRVDFMLLAMNQITNMVATARFGSSGKLKVPLVIRAVIGRGWGQGFQHSKSLQSIFAHIPGLKVVMPSSPYDVKGLLISAIRDDNPVIFLEHRWLYWLEGAVPVRPYTVPIGKARVVKQGRDITIVATSWMNVEAYKAADILARKHKVELEIVDPRTIYPLDEETILRSAEKTGHVIVADYDWEFCGFSAEVAARISEKLFGKLKSPVTRIAFPHTHCATTRPLENEFYPNAVDIIRAVEKKLKLKKTDLSGEEFYSWENKFKGPF